MVNKYIIILTLFFFKLSLYSQVNISFDKDCLKKNSAIFAHLLIEYAGEEKVIELLENDVNIVTFCEVDSLGSFVKINKLMSKKQFSKSFIDSLEVYIINSKEKFFICYEKLPGHCDKDSYKLIKKDLFDYKNTHMINIAFPGELLEPSELKKNDQQIKGLSKYKYLLEQSEKFTPR